MENVRLALILAVQAEIEGMKAENKQREIMGDSLSYDEESFQNKAEHLRGLAYANIDKPTDVSMKNKKLEDRLKDEYQFLSDLEEKKGVKIMRSLIDKRIRDILFKLENI